MVHDSGRWELESVWKVGRGGGMLGFVGCRVEEGNVGDVWDCGELVSWGRELDCREVCDVGLGNGDMW